MDVGIGVYIATCCVGTDVGIVATAFVGGGVFVEGDTNGPRCNRKASAPAARRIPAPKTTFPNIGCTGLWRVFVRFCFFIDGTIVAYLWFG